MQFDDTWETDVRWPVTGLIFLCPYLARDLINERHRLLPLETRGQLG